VFPHDGLYCSFADFDALLFQLLVDATRTVAFPVIDKDFVDELEKSSARRASRFDTPPFLRHA